jgi:hypothetical protein
VRALKQVGVDFIKVHRRTPREDYFAIVEEAKQQGLMVVGHIPMTVTPFEASDAGQQIEHAYTLFEGTLLGGEDDSKVPEAIQRLLAPAGEADSLFARFVHNHTAVDATLIPYHLAADTSFVRGPDMRYVAESGKAAWRKISAPLSESELAVRHRVDIGLQAVVGRMHRAGVALLAGTDLSVILPPGFTLHDELALLVASGVSPLAALQSATVNPAKVIKRQDELGTVAPGKLADLVLLDANPLVDIRNTRRITAVVLGGRVLDRGALDGLLRLGEQMAREN